MKKPRARRGQSQDWRCRRRAAPIGSVAGPCGVYSAGTRRRASFASSVVRSEAMPH
jgi:hypothetical protein